jgi:maltose alpha-D-glucosyltransferase/alpha-amylase
MTSQTSTPSALGSARSATSRSCSTERITGGEYGYETVNVAAQRRDPDSLLAWFERMIRTLREAPEAAAGECRYVDLPLPGGVLAHRADAATGTMVFLHNLSTEPARADLSALYGESKCPTEVLADRDYADVGRLDMLDIDGYGYRWIRLRHTPYA